MATCSSLEKGGAELAKRHEHRMWSIWGLKKTQFNSVDFGTVTVSTYAVRQS